MLKYFQNHFQHKLSTIEKVILGFAFANILFSLAMIEFYDHYMMHYKRYTVYLLLKILITGGLLTIFKSNWIEKQKPLGKSWSVHISGLIPILSILYLYILSTSLPGYLTFFDFFSIIIFYNLLINFLFPNKSSAGLATSISIFCFLIIFAEIFFRFSDLQPSKKSLPDYSDLYSKSFYPGGQLKPDQNVEAWGYFGPVKWITNSDGFRNEQEFKKPKPENTLRINLIGDSFLAGYRTDQQNFLGTLLQQNLKNNITKSSQNIEVMNIAVEEQFSALYWLKKHGFEYQPDIIIAGICLGNDISQSHIFIQPDSIFNIEQKTDELKITKSTEEPKVGFHTPPFYGLYLPQAAYKSQSNKNPILDALKKSHLGIRFMAIYWMISNPGIHSMYSDEWNKVHLFDNGHGLGYYYKPILPQVQKAIADWRISLLEINRLCKEKEIGFKVVLIPQRFSVSDQDWQAATKRFNLNPEKFDRDQLAEIILNICNENEIDALDLTKAMKEIIASEEENLFMPVGDMHWNDTGHQIVAEEISSWLTKQINPASE